MLIEEPSALDVGSAAASAETVRITQLYPALQRILARSRGLPPGACVVNVPAAAELFSESRPCSGFPLVLRGEVRVTQTSGDGRSLELYRITPGELCLVSAACLFQSQAIAARGNAVRATELLLITPALFRDWLGEAEFRDFVLQIYAQRLADLGHLVGALAFQKLDRRLAAALLGHGQEIATTHQDLADAVGTVREMVTRLLHRFEQAGWVELSRERIRILDSASLRRCAEGL